MLTLPGNLFMFLISFLPKYTDINRMIPKGAALIRNPIFAPN